MAFTRHGSYLVQVTRLWFVNAYLVLEDDGATGVDTTLKGGAQAILDAARAVGAPIRRLTVTHGHRDHVGPLDALVERLPDAEVVVRRPRRAPHGRRPHGDSGEPRGFGTSGRMARMVYPRVGTRPARTLCRGRPARLARGRGRPGRTPGQVGFLEPAKGESRPADTRDGTLLCAGVYATLTAPVTEVRPTLRSPVPALFTWHRPTALEAARRLHALDVARLRPATAGRSSARRGSWTGPSRL